MCQHQKCSSPSPLSHRPNLPKVVKTTFQSSVLFLKILQSDNHFLRLRPTLNYLKGGVHPERLIQVENFGPSTKIVHPTTTRTKIC